MAVLTVDCSVFAMATWLVVMRAHTMACLTAAMKVLTMDGSREKLMVDFEADELGKWLVGYLVIELVGKMAGDSVVY